MTCASRCGREAPVTCTHPRGQAPHETEFRMRLARLALALLSMVPLHVFAGEIDGRIEPGEWQGAYHVTGFPKLQPLSGATASLPTEAWILAKPAGLAVAFRNLQPASVPRTRQREQRHFAEPVHPGHMIVALAGDGRPGTN